MKKSLFYCLFAVLCAVNLFSSCSENEGIVIPIDSDLAGKYKGKLDVSISQNGVDIPGGTVESQIIAVMKAGDNAVSLSITDFSFMGIEIGDINLNDCVLKANGSNYEFNGATKVEAESLTADVDATGVFSNGTLSLNLDIDATLTGGLKQTVKVTYSGTRLKGDESSEAKITSFVFDREVAAVDSLVIGETAINEEAKTITFMVADTAKAEYLTALVPTIEVSKGATVVPVSGEAQDFSNGKIVTYTVTAEDGTVAEYKVSIASKIAVYDFETWIPGVEGQEPDMTFYYPIGWASSNAGTQMLKALGMTDSYAVEPSEDAHSGKKSALIRSVDSKGQKPYPPFLPAIPKLTTGSMFLGNFIIDTKNTLNSTKFGIPYFNKPVSLKGWYKYTPGETYYIVKQEPYIDHCHEAVVDESKTDEFLISVVLYETDEFDTSGWSDCLTGVSDKESNIYFSNRVAAIAQLTGGEQMEWKNFELTLDWKQAFSIDKKYRMAIICSASKDGDKFWGAPGSTLLVDDLELVVE